MTDDYFQVLHNNVPSVQLGKGKYLYRVQSKRPNKDKLKLNKCEDTGKNGIYFSDGPFIPLGMILEYNKDMYLGVWVLNEDIKCHVGKYSFRELEGQRFFTSAEKHLRNEYILNLDPKYSWNHIDDSAFPVHEIFTDWHPPESEIFLNQLSVSNLQLHTWYEISVDKANEDLLKRKRNDNDAKYTGFTKNPK